MLVLKREQEEGDEAESDLTEVISAIEVELTARLSGGGGERERATRRSRGGGSGSGGSGSGSGGSGGSSSSSGGGPSPPQEELVPVASAVELISEVDTRVTLATNAARLLEGRLTRPLSAAEIGRLNELIMEALTVLQPDESMRLQLVAAPLGSALVDRNCALVWSSIVSAVDFDDITSMARFSTVFLRLVGEFNGGLLVANLE